MNRIFGVDVGALFRRVSAFSTRHAARVFVVGAVLAVAGLVLALGLGPNAGSGKLSDAGVRRLPGSWIAPSREKRGSVPPGGEP